MAERLLGEDADPHKIEALVDDLAATLNRHCVESDSHTPDFILARFLVRCLDAYGGTIRSRRDWFGVPEFPDSALLGPRPALDPPGRDR